MSTFYDNYVKLCAARKESLTAVSKNIGLSNAAPTGWKNGKMPSKVTLAKLASYFGIPEEELTGEEPEQKEKPTPSEESGLDAAFNAVLDQLTEQELADVLQYAKFKVASRKENSNG